jgi:hypothetical protein
MSASPSLETQLKLQASEKDPEEIISAYRSRSSHAVIKGQTAVSGLAHDSVTASGQTANEPLLDM